MGADEDVLDVVASAAAVAATVAGCAGCAAVIGGGCAESVVEKIWPCVKDFLFGNYFDLLLFCFL